MDATSEMKKQAKINQRIMAVVEKNQEFTHSAGSRSQRETEVPMDPETGMSRFESDIHTLLIHHIVDQEEEGYKEAKSEGVKGGKYCVEFFRGKCKKGEDCQYQHTKAPTVCINFNRLGKRRCINI